MKTTKTTSRVPPTIEEKKKLIKEIKILCWVFIAVAVIMLITSILEVLL